MARVASSHHPTTMPRSASISDRRCCPGLNLHTPETYQAILRRTGEPEKFLWTRLGVGPSLQPYDSALGEPPDQYTQVSGGFGISSTASAGRRKECGFPKPRWIWRPWTFWQSLGCASRSSRPIRPAGFGSSASATWRDVSGGAIDPTTPYLLRFPSGRRLTLFSTTVPSPGVWPSRACSHGGNTSPTGSARPFSEERTWPQLVHIATDGETYGHHHRHGDMALAYALDYIDTN